MTGSAEGAWQRARGCLGLGREGEGPQHLSPTIRAKWLLGSWQIPGSRKTLRQGLGLFLPLGSQHLHKTLTVTRQSEIAFLWGMGRSRA